MRGAAGGVGAVRPESPQTDVGHGSFAFPILTHPSLVAPEIDKGTFDGPHNGRLTVPDLLLITSGRPAAID